MGRWGERVFKKGILLLESKLLVFFPRLRTKIKRNTKINEQTRRRDNPRSNRINSDLGQVRVCLFFQSGREPAVKRPSLRHISFLEACLQKLRVYERSPLRLSVNVHP